MLIKSTITCRAYPRAALIGNPSDGYYGKTIAFVFSNYRAEVTLSPDSMISFIGNSQDENSYQSLDSFDEHINRFGYYGGVRLMKATLSVFLNYCRDHNISLSMDGFTMSYDSDIPIRLGLAGSSAIITAILKSLCTYYQLVIPEEILPNLVLSVEKDELQIMGGLQDRVAQVYNRPVIMSFEKTHMDKHGYGIYESIDRNLLENLFIVYDQSASEGSEVIHNDLRERFDSGELAVVNAMHQFTNDPKQENLVELIRSTGASAKFTGSGGAIIGMYDSEEELELLSSKLKGTEAELIIPTIVDEA